MDVITYFLFAMASMFVGYKTGRESERESEGFPWFSLIGSAIGLLMGAFLLAVVLNIE